MYNGSLSEQSNRSDWIEVIELSDLETGDLIDLTLCRITLSVRKSSGQSSSFGSGGYDNFSSGSFVMTGSTDDGTVTLVDVGTFQWQFLAAQMAGLCPGAYNVGVRITQDSRTVQLIIGTVNIVEGIDMQ